ncbi:MAG: hypothetical protein IKW49_02295 [Opitutales bacterium]|nr:hypothetical protein [Opitutales bacterium]
MKINKLLVLISVTTLPFLAACMSPTERIAHGLSAGTLTQAEARKAFDDGAEVSAHLLKEAAHNGEFEILHLFIKKGANPWEMKDSTGTFSLFDYATQGNDSYLLQLCLSFRGRYPELAEKKSTAFVESVIAASTMNKNLEGELRAIWQIWNAGLALETMPKMEAGRKRITEEKTRIEKERRRKTREVSMPLEKQMIRNCLREKVLTMEQKLSEVERSRGRALLEAFGEEQMPILADLCKNARLSCLEAEANLEDLVKALRAEKNDWKVSDVFQAAEKRWLDLASDYWWLRYKLTDFYSQFKIGAITSDELAERDAEFAEK